MEALSLPFSLTTPVPGHLRTIIHWAEFPQPASEKLINRPFLSTGSAHTIVEIIFWSRWAGYSNGPVSGKVAVQPQALLKTRILRCDETVLLCVAGELDIATSPLLDHATQACLSEPTDTFLLDLTDLSFCDRTGLRALHRLAEAVRSATDTLYLAGIHPHLKRTLALPGASPICTQPARLK
ncbi:STAS domain-containing protein [Streptomyces sp. 1222.5]|uniref:STAS domain-containing protein n=1 Tax=Streptomyces sp. 1222.5 TaxID=1881026 RepID=UPI003EBDEC47